MTIWLRIHKIAPTYLHCPESGRNIEAPHVAEILIVRVAAKHEDERVNHDHRRLRARGGHHRRRFRRQILPHARRKVEIPHVVQEIRHGRQRVEVSVAAKHEETVQVSGRRLRVGATGCGRTAGHSQKQVNKKYDVCMCMVTLHSAGNTSGL